MSMTPAAIKAVVEGLYESRLKNDVDKCLRHFASNGTLRMAGSETASSIAATAAGPEGLRTIFTSLVGDWEWLGMENKTYVIQDDRAAVYFLLHARYVPTQEEVRTELLDLFEVRDGKIASLVEFVDTATVAQLSDKADDETLH